MLDLWQYVHFYGSKMLIYKYRIMAVSKITLIQEQICQIINSKGNVENGGLTKLFCIEI